MHEIGHLLGQNHADDGMMAETLAAGTRQVPASDAYWADLGASPRSDETSSGEATWPDPANAWGLRK